MERRSFFKNLAALTLIMQIPINKKEKELNPIRFIKINIGNEIRYMPIY